MENIDRKQWNKEQVKAPNGQQPSENSLCGAGEHSIYGAGQPSLCYSVCGARELALCVAGENLSCKAGEPSLCDLLYETGEHTLCAAEEHPLCGTEGRNRPECHSLYRSDKHTLHVAGEHSLYITGESTSEGLSFSNGTGEHRPCVVAEEHTSCVAGEHSLCRTAELPACVAEERGQQQSCSCEPLSRRLTLLTFCVVALNIGMFFVTMYINDCPSTSHSCFLPFLHRLSFQPLHENMLIGASSQTLERLGALDAIKVQHAHQGWRLITCIWLHAGVVHVLVNMISLLFIGIQLEQEFGSVKVGMIFLLSGFGGSLLSVLFLQNVSVGGSGALFGLVGAMLSELLTNWTIYSNKCAVITVLIFVVAANLAMGIFPFVDNFAHIGGLIVGFLSGFVLLIKPQYGYIKPSSLTSGNSIQSSVKAKYKGYQYLLWVIAFILLIAGIAGVAVLVFQGVDGNKKCHWCHFLSCIPTSKWDCHNSISCNEFQVDNQWQITCVSNHKTTFAQLNQSDVVLKELCIQLCS